jgi:hypothetical protein
MHEVLGDCRQRIVGQSGCSAAEIRQTVSQFEPVEEGEDFVVGSVQHRIGRSKDRPAFHLLSFGLQGAQRFAVSSAAI